ncbi:class I SAM-dependent methyltransferase [Candidatus Bipolaricaulota bacterium]|nr:class I SAM-dependent methyltransferase [Candidatus Bipolaricaulota bacterium]
MPSDTYEKLAARYDRMLSENPAREAFFRDLFTKHGVKRVLDCACGTGRDLIAFAKMGFEVEGSDLSEAMLARTRLNLARAGLNVPVGRADFRELDEHFEPQFDAVVCLRNSINELLDDSEVVKALRAMRTVLRPGGIVVIDQGQTDASMREPPLCDVVVNEPDFTRVLVMEYNADIMTVHIVDRVHTEGKPALLTNMSCQIGATRRNSPQCEFPATSKELDEGEFPVVRLKIRLREDWQRLFEEAGFSGVEFTGNWDGGAYDDRAKRLIVLAAV